jgi:hypothetical protein
MKEMAKHVPDAGSYAPVTLLVDERDDGVHLSYDRITSFLAPYHNAAASGIACAGANLVSAILFSWQSRTHGTRFHLTAKNGRAEEDASIRLQGYGEPQAATEPRSIFPIP